MTETVAPTEALPQATERSPFYDGITDEVFFDYFRDRQEFVRSAMDRLKAENPYLCTYVVRATILTEPSDLARDWALFYYEMCARSAGHAGRRLPEVSEERLRSIYSEVAERVRASQVSEEKMRENFIEENRAINRIIDIDLEQDKGRHQFWSLQMNLRLRHKILGKNTEETKMLFEPLYMIVGAFQKQESSNKLGNKFSS